MKRESEFRNVPQVIGFADESLDDLLSRSDLSWQQKVDILRQWELDLRERMVAEEDNMPATEPVSVTLDEVLEALRSLGALSEFRNVTTKHG